MPQELNYQAQLGMGFPWGSRQDVTYKIRLKEQPMHARIMALLLLCGLAFSTPATAQERFGTLTGRVTDQQGAAVPGVTVTTTNNATGEVRVFVSDANGHYIAPDLNPGRYT